MRRLNIFLVIILAVFITTGCNASSSSSDDSEDSAADGAKTAVVITWDANREQGVNQAGGGYRVSYSLTSTTHSIAPVNVPWVSGSTAPTSTILNLAAGTYYVSVTAYSALNPTGSLLSSETTVTVP